jgi:hypothetical protein
MKALESQALKIKVGVHEKIVAFETSVFFHYGAVFGNEAMPAENEVGA